MTTGQTRELTSENTRVNPERSPRHAWLHPFLRAGRSVRIGEAHVANPEAQFVEPLDHARERRGGVLVDDDLAGVHAECIR
jgi:hypothetical protein